MSKYFWLLALVIFFGLSFFNNFFISPKSNLANLIQLNLPEQPRVVRQGGKDILEAKIYSTYPFNSRSLLTINAGEENGVRIGMPATIGGKVLFGKVLEVSQNKSIIRTFFDKDFSLPVRIGNKEANALLVGGQSPRLSLIDKLSDIKEGDGVFSAGQDFPYGMAVGAVGAISDSSSNSLLEASLDVPYQISDLREAVILLE